MKSLCSLTQITHLSLGVKKEVVDITTGWLHQYVTSDMLQSFSLSFPYLRSLSCSLHVSVCEIATSSASSTDPSVGWRYSFPHLQHLELELPKMMTLTKLGSCCPSLTSLSLSLPKLNPSLEVLSDIKLAQRLTSFSLIRREIDLSGAVTPKDHQRWSQLITTCTSLTSLSFQSRGEGWSFPSVLGMAQSLRRLTIQPMITWDYLVAIPSQAITSMTPSSTTLFKLQHLSFHPPESSLSRLFESLSSQCPSLVSLDIRAVTCQTIITDEALPIVTWFPSLVIHLGRRIQRLKLPDNLNAIACRNCLVPSPKLRQEKTITSSPCTLVPASSSSSHPPESSSSSIPPPVSVSNSSQWLPFPTLRRLSFGCDNDSTAKEISDELKRRYGSPLIITLVENQYDLSTLFD
jgi:hypothetical protein